MKRIIAILFAIFLSVTASAESKNPGNRYMEEYKKYLTAQCPIESDNIKNFVYFARDREAIQEHPFLKYPRFEGAQIMYSWKELEPSEGHYDFAIIKDDYDYLKLKGKKLFIQLQDATFNPDYYGVPDFLRTAKFDDGAIYQRDDNGKPEGWTAKRWNKNVRESFAKLLNALGKEFDGKIEGINLQESAIGVTSEYDKSFSPSIYVESLKENMLALKTAFPHSITMQYANFMPGEWLPWEDKGYLKAIYEYGEKIGVGLGAPDLMIRKKGQLNHALAMMHEHNYSVPLGIAVQDGNYLGLTDSNLIKKDRENIVPMLHAFAKEFLKVQYIFWVNQEPYFEEDVLPCFISHDK
ncbi:MAG: hypothetical protein KKB51_00225 [Candidatus Riflebacteria bacterium]|nr:hypothetical protein [Candidatus Riflebacteria bacterium]